MKNYLILSLILLFTGCTQQEYLVRSDHAPDVDFEKYNSYAFATNISSNNAELFLDDLSLKNKIREEVRGEMEAKGYTFDLTDPDLLVNFRVFEKPVDMQGYQQQNFEYWGTEDVIDVENKKTYNLDAGTLVVDIVENETKRVVWTGYASGILKEDDSFDKSDNAVAAAVEKIFNNYNYRAEEL
ncbi:MAG: DUF4136 domain-containing protein [Candidatus Cyclobacteriaceae bacterium M2_1C_046]